MEDKTLMICMVVLVLFMLIRNNSGRSECMTTTSSGGNCIVECKDAETGGFKKVF